MTCGVHNTDEGEGLERVELGSCSSPVRRCWGVYVAVCMRAPVHTPMPWSVRTCASVCGVCVCV